MLAKSTKARFLQESLDSILERTNQNWICVLSILVFHPREEIRCPAVSRFWLYMCLRDLQNWMHVLTLFDHLNRIPQSQHGTDFMRIREWWDLFIVVCASFFLLNLWNFKQWIKMNQSFYILHVVFVGAWMDILDIIDRPWFYQHSLMQVRLELMEAIMQ